MIMKLCSRQPFPRAQQIAAFTNSFQKLEGIGYHAKGKLDDKDFFLNLLSSGSTERETKRYLSRLDTTPPRLVPKPATRLQNEFSKAKSSGSLSTLFEGQIIQNDPERLHLALIKFSIPQSLDGTVINGVAKTLSHLVRLETGCCVIVDLGQNENCAAMRQAVKEQVYRLSAAIDEQPGAKSSCLDSGLSLSYDESGQPTVKYRDRKRLVGLLRERHIVIVPPIAYTDKSCVAVPVTADEALMALIYEFAGFPVPDSGAETTSTSQTEVSVDQIILLHPEGGIPAFDGVQATHGFINLEEDFDDIMKVLTVTRDSKHPLSPTASNSACGSLERDIISKPTSQGVVSGQLGQPRRPSGATSMRHALDGHLQNLKLSQWSLAMLPSAASSIITSPQEAAISVNSSHAVGSDMRQRNPLIHSILTDKPLISPSLPQRRRNASFASSLTSRTTFLKRGIPLTTLPDPRVKPWTPQNRGLRLSELSINLSRLVYLIENSFNRKLDLERYLDRINDRIACVIIAGEYEGGAILTWELPPDVVDDGSEESKSRMVPYLDKFAVLKRSQGTNCIADIMFNAMLRLEFPNGVCWRSRRDNPVNKWYFERSCGFWNLSPGPWSMFWTTPALLENEQKFRDYQAVCRTIQPTWSDGKRDVD